MARRRFREALTRPVSDRQVLSNAALKSESAAAAACSTWERKLELTRTRKRIVELENATSHAATELGLVRDEISAARAAREMAGLRRNDSQNSLDAQLRTGDT